MKGIQVIGFSLAALIALVSAPAQAGSGTPAGWYIGGGGLTSLQTEADSKVGGSTNIIKYDAGWGVFGNGGYAWGNGVRTEAEIAYRRSGVDSVSGTGSGAGDGTIANTSFMGNVLYDFDTGSRFTPYLGAGLGAAVVHADNIQTVVGRTLDSTRVQFAYQAIAGVSAALDKNWTLAADYRYYRTTDPHFRSDAGDRAVTDNASHNFVVGVRYRFDQAPQVAPPPPPPAPRLPVAQPAPVVVPPPAPPVDAVVPPVPQSYMVFFDFDRSVLTAEARRIIASAAQEFRRGGYVRVVVTGHTDTSGPNRYNQRLSERRASAVRTEFARLGVPESEIAMHGAGESGLLVPTSDGVREAQNRRAEIVLNK